MKPCVLTPQNTRFLMIDMQEKLLPAIAGWEKIQKNSIVLVSAAKVLQIPLTVTEQYPKGLGPTVRELHDLLTEKPFAKTSFGCFDEDGFKELFNSKGQGRDHVVIFGIESHICVHSTALQLLTKGFGVTVAADGCGSRDEKNHLFALSHMSSLGVHVLPMETIVYGLLGRSGTPEFKKLLPFFKE